MSLPIDVLHKPGRNVYAIVFDVNGNAWNPTTAAFEALDGGTGCPSGAAHAIELTEKDCVPGWYEGSAAIVNAGVYTVMAWEQQGTEADIGSDLNLGATETDYDGTEEITDLDLKVLIEQIEAGVVQNGGLTRHQARMLTEIYQRKNNNRPAK